MSEKMDRREFLKLSGAGVATVAAITTLGGPKALARLEKEAKVRIKTAESPLVEQTYVMIAVSNELIEDTKFPLEEYMGRMVARSLRNSYEREENT